MKFTNKKPSIPEKARKSLPFPAHTLSCNQLIRELEANPQYGLKCDDAASRLLEYGRNELDVRHSVQPFRILLRQISNAMMMVSKAHLSCPHDRKSTTHA
jgi:magnesium-transporting ATPase (P-type)